MPSSSSIPIPVPIPDAVAVLIGSQMPAHVLLAEIAAERAASEARWLRPTGGSASLDDDDRHDRECRLSDLARHNKVLAAYNPRLIVKAGGPRG